MTTSSAKAETIKQNNQFAYLYSLSSILLANTLTRLESDKTRKGKMSKIVTKKINQYKSLFPKQSETVNNLTEMKKVCRKTDLGDKKLKLMIDLSCSAPFFPYQLNYNEKQFNDAFIEVGKVLGLYGPVLDNIIKAKEAAFKLHKPSRLFKKLMIGLGGALFFAAGGWMLGPVIGGLLGAAAGLSGAAATSFGLALLGGGSLAAGGMGMAGGMWLITGVSAAIGMVGTTATTMLTEMSTANVVQELIKLQINYDVLDANKTPKTHDKYIYGLVNQKSQLDSTLKTELTLNEEDSENIKTLKAKIEAFERTIKWMKSKN